MNFLFVLQFFFLHKTKSMCLTAFGDLNAFMRSRETVLWKFGSLCVVGGGEGDTYPFYPVNGNKYAIFMIDTTGNNKAHRGVYRFT